MTKPLKAAFTYGSLLLTAAMFGCGDRPIIHLPAEPKPKAKVSEEPSDQLVTHQYPESMMAADLDNMKSFIPMIGDVVLIKAESTNGQKQSAMSITHPQQWEAFLDKNQWSIRDHRESNQSSVAVSYFDTLRFISKTAFFSTAFDQKRLYSFQPTVWKATDVPEAFGFTTICFPEGNRKLFVSVDPRAQTQTEQFQMSTQVTRTEFKEFINVHEVLPIEVFRYMDRLSAKEVRIRCTTELQFYAQNIEPLKITLPVFELQLTHDKNLRSFENLMGSRVAVKDASGELKLNQYLAPSLLNEVNFAFPKLGYQNRPEHKQNPFYLFELGQDTTTVEELNPATVPTQSLLICDEFMREKEIPDSVTFIRLQDMGNPISFKNHVDNINQFPKKHCRILGIREVVVDNSTADTSSAPKPQQIVTHVSQVFPVQMGNYRMATKTGKRGELNSKKKDHITHTKPVAWSQIVTNTHRFPVKAKLSGLPKGKHFEFKAHTYAITQDQRPFTDADREEARRMGLAMNFAEYYRTYLRTTPIRVTAKVLDAKKKVLKSLSKKLNSGALIDLAPGYQVEIEYASTLKLECRPGKVYGLWFMEKSRDGKDVKFPKQAQLDVYQLDMFDAKATGPLVTSVQVFPMASKQFSPANRDAKAIDPYDSRVMLREHCRKK